MVIAMFVRQALLDEPIGVFGDGSQTRCFAHVLDVVPRLAELVKRSDAYGLVMNVRPQEEISIEFISDQIQIQRTADSLLASVTTGF